MKKSLRSTDLSPEILSLPLVAGDSPFDLSTEEQKLDGDGWAWRFLRVNPLYQTDYELWKSREEKWREISARFRPNGPIVALASDAPPTPVPAELLDFDSRYFAVDGNPLGGSLEDWTYKNETLGAFLAKHPGINLKTIQIREFDAPGDYGIGAWLDPSTKRLQRLPVARATGPGSWFYHVNEPIWEVHIESAMQANLLLHKLPDGQRIAYGRDRYVRANFTLQDNLIPATKPQKKSYLKSIPLFPSISSNLSPTQIRFLVCLDGYVRPQVAMAFQIASEFREMHRKLNQGFLSGNARAQQTIIENPVILTGRSTGIFTGLSGMAVRTRKHWCAITIDVVGAPGGQRKDIEAALIKKQGELEGQLTSPVRMRKTKLDARLDNPLKRALCFVELHKHGEIDGDSRQPIPWNHIGTVIYRPDSHGYYHVRGLPVPPNVKLNKGGLPEQSKREHVLASRELSQSMAFGRYEFLTSLKFGPRLGLDESGE